MTELEKWRERLNLNKKAAAEQLGISRDSFAAYAMGTKPTPLTVRLAAGALAYGLPPIPEDTEE